MDDLSIPSVHDGGPYEGLSTEDLVKLAEQRGLGISRGHLLKLLDDQDRRHSERPFPFMSLPAELRDSIYGYVCADFPFEQRTAFDSRRGKVCSRQPLPTLTCVSAQVRRECLAILFGSKSVQLFADHDGSCLHSTFFILRPTSENLIEHRSPHVALYRSVRVDFMLEVTDGDWSYDIKLFIQRNVKANPQYSIVCKGTSSAYRILEYNEGKRPNSALYRAYDNNEIRQEALDYYNRIPSYVGHLAQMILNDHANTFNYSAVEINKLLKRLPTSVRRTDMDALQGSKSALRQKLQKR